MQAIAKVIVLDVKHLTCADSQHLESWPNVPPRSGETVFVE